MEESWFAQALRLHAAGRLIEAGEAYQQILAANPSHLPAVHLSGVLAFRIGHPDLGAQFLGHALGAASGVADFHRSMGKLLSDAGLAKEAADAYRQLRASAGRNAPLLLELGRAFREIGEAEATAEAFGALILLVPHDANVRIDHGAALLAVGRIDEAVDTYQMALRLSPESTAALCGLSCAYRSQHRLAEAANLAGKAARLAPNAPDILNLFGSILTDQGSPTEATALFARASALDPAAVRYRSNLLLAATHADFSDAHLAELHRQAGQAIEAPHRAGWRPHGNARSESRRLRVGYVSADFRLHSSIFFLEPLLRCHDRQAVDIVCYSDVRTPDSVTEGLARHASLWRSVERVDDDALAEQIRADGIDILVDLAGHAAGNRLGVFARKPAPIQVAWLGCGATTGLTAMDWRLTDPWLTPDPCPEFFSEKLWRLSRCSFSYGPAEGVPPPGPLPMDGAGVATFGACDDIAKISPATIDLWSRVLHAVPGSRLLLQAQAIGDKGTADRCSARFAANGIAPQRLILRPHQTDFAAHLGEYDAIDLMLDTLPHNGFTTTCEALWRGVPVVTLPGSRMVSRLGGTFLAAVGLDELVARSADDFVAIAGRLASSPEQLRHLRQSLPGRVLASPLCDGAGFARAVEDAYRGMWAAWCRNNGGAG